MTRWKTASFPQKRIVRGEKCVVVRAVGREFRRPRPSRNSLQNDHEYRVVGDRLASQQCRALAVGVVTKQTDGVKAYWNHGDDSATHGALEHFVVFAKYICLPHLPLEWRILFDEYCGSTNDDCRRNPILALAQLHG